MKININKKRERTTFEEVGQGEVFMIGSAAYMRMTGKWVKDVHYNAWSLNYNDLVHIETDANVIIPQKVTLEVTI